ncbi:MAG: hypothetical protein RL499_125 [Actinomycetota bacterium]
MTAPASPRPEVVVRARAGRWMHGLVVSAALVVAGSGALLAEGVAAGIPTIVVSGLVLASFAVLVVSLATITLRWRTSVRCDGFALVVRDPLGARVIPVHEGLALAAGSMRATDPLTGFSTTVG